VDDAWGTTKMKVSGGEAVRVEVEPDPNATPDAPEAIPLDVVFEDPMLLVINKPVGLVVHPGSGNPRGTLLNAAVAPGAAGGTNCRVPGSSTGWTRTPRACWVVGQDPARAHTTLVRQLQCTDRQA